MHLHEIANRLTRSKRAKHEVTVCDMREVIRELAFITAECIRKGQPTPLDYIHRKAWLLAHKGRADLGAMHAEYDLSIGEANFEERI